MFVSCTLVSWYTFLLPGSWSSADRVWQRSTKKRRNLPDGYQVNMDVNNAQFKFFKNRLQMFEEGNAFSVFVRPQGYTRCVLVGNADCKQSFCKCPQQNTAFVKFPTVVALLNKTGTKLSWNVTNYPVVQLLKLLHFPKSSGATVLSGDHVQTVVVLLKQERGTWGSRSSWIWQENKCRVTPQKGWFNICIPVRRRIKIKYMQAHILGWLLFNLKWCNWV